jgi:hypothetical protein
MMSEIFDEATLISTMVAMALETQRAQKTDKNTAQSDPYGA